MAATAPLPPAPCRLAPDRAVIWWLFVDDLGRDALACLEACLADDELARAARFQFERDRRVFVAAHALCRGMLSAHFNLAPRLWRFRISALGKPEVAVPPGGPRLRINISHTNGLAAVALAREHDIGVDVEWLGRPVDVATMARHAFSPQERAALDEVGEAERCRAFFTLWTLKEAYIKATGKGLSEPLDGFTIDPAALAIRFRDAGADDPGRWLFRLFSPGRDHLAALAVRHPDPGRLSILAGPAPLDRLLGCSDAAPG